MMRTRPNLSLLLTAADLPILIAEAAFLVHHTSGQAHIDRIGRVSFVYFPVLLFMNFLIFRIWKRLPEPPKPPGAGPLLLPDDGPGFWRRLDVTLAYVVGSFLCSAGLLAMLAMEWQLSARSSLASAQFKLSLTAIAIGFVLLWRGRRLQTSLRRPRRTGMSPHL